MGLRRLEGAGGELEGAGGLLDPPPLDEGAGGELLEYVRQELRVGLGGDINLGSGLGKIKYFHKLSVKLCEIMKPNNPFLPK